MAIRVCWMRDKEWRDSALQQLQKTIEFREICLVARHARLERGAPLSFLIRSITPLRGNFAFISPSLLSGVATFCIASTARQGSMPTTPALSLSGPAFPSDRGLRSGMCASAPAPDNVFSAWARLSS